MRSNVLKANVLSLIINFKYKIFPKQYNTSMSRMKKSELQNKVQPKIKEEYIRQLRRDEFACITCNKP